MVRNKIFFILTWCLLPFKDVIFSDFSVFDVDIFALFFNLSLISFICPNLEAVRQ